MKKVPIDDHLYAELEALVALSDGVLPLSVESAVNMAVEAFLEGVDEVARP